MSRRIKIFLVAAVGIAGVIPYTAVIARQATGPATTRAAEDSDALGDIAALRAAYALPADQWPAATWDDGVPVADRRELGPVPEVVFPASDPRSVERVELGRRLFYEPRLSGSTFVACVSCHHPDLGWADGKRTSQGHQLQPLDRNAPSLLGTAFHEKLMWDGRADSLEDQALLPLVNDREMRGKLDDVEKAINAIPEYRAEFKAVYGEEDITIDLIARALATFQRTIVPGRSKFDAFLTGRHRALSDAQLRGLHLFRTKARCINCHNGPLLTDGQFHNVGLTYYGRPFEDLGRYVETGIAADVGRFRTPSLRNVSRTGPYMHNGLFELDGVINLYNSGMPNEKAPPGDPLAPKKSPLLRPLQLTPGERDDLTAFLTGALEEPRLRVRGPKLPGLYQERGTQKAE